MRTAALALALFAVLAPVEAVSQEKRLKLRIAVAPIDWGSKKWFDNWQVPVEFRTGIDEKLQKKLLETGRFVVLERGELEALLQEQAIKEENTGKSQKGKIVFAQALVKGTLTDFSVNSRGGGVGVNIGGIGRVGAAANEAKVAINVRIFNVDTSELIASEEATGKVGAAGFSFSGNHRTAFTNFSTFEKSPLGGAMTKAIDQTVEKIVAKLEKIPWSTRVADFDPASKEVTLAAGKNLGVQVGDTFEVHKVSRVIKDPETGEVLGVRTAKIGVIRVKEVEDKIAFAEVLEGEGFGPGDIVREPKR